MKKSAMNKAITTALCTGVFITSTTTSASITNYSWGGILTVLDSSGAAIANTSIPAKGNNQYQTPISGTLAFDNFTGAATATIEPFYFFSSSYPGETVGITMQSIGDGVGGAGTLILANMLYNWSGSSGIPISVVLDAQGFLAGDLGGGGLGEVPASDGTYVGPAVPDTVVGPGGYAGYLGLGPIPMATTAWNTTISPGCSLGDCSGVNPSGLLPLILDDALNSHDYIPNTGGDGTWTNYSFENAKGIGGSPSPSGPFAGSNWNFNFTNITITSTETGAIGPFYVGPEPVPIPAAVWLFGSGLIGLVGLARCKP